MRWSIALLVALSGCPGTVPGDDTGMDGSTPSAALHVNWSPRPQDVPGNANPNISIDRATFGIDSLRVVGDAGPTTSLDNIKLEWDQNGGPEPITFKNAAPGLYSRMEWLLDTQNQMARENNPVYVFEIVGEAKIGGNDEPYRLRDSTALSIAFDVRADLAPPDDATITVRVDLIRIVTAVDFSMLPVTSGERLLDHGDPQMEAIRKKVGEAFSKDDPATR